MQEEHGKMGLFIQYSGMITAQTENERMVFPL